MGHPEPAQEGESDGLQLTIPYETLLALVEQLPPEERRDLLHRIQGQAKSQALTDEEWRTAFRAAMIDRSIAGPISLSRADWYDDDGR